MPTYISRCSGFVLCALVLICAIQFSSTSAAPDGFSNSGSNRRQTTLLDPEDDGRKRLREGTMITDVIGYFRQDGDGATFVADDGQEFGGLSNLNLERVVRTLKSADDSKRLRWSVSGTVTEFMSRNFILVSRAVHKSTALPPSPDQLSS